LSDPTAAGLAGTFLVIQWFFY